MTSAWALAGLQVGPCTRWNNPAKVHFLLLHFPSLPVFHRAFSARFAVCYPLLGLIIMISSAAARVLSPLPNHAPLKEGEERRRLIKHTRREGGTCLISEADGNIIGTAQGFYPASEGRQVIE